jgi:hypothetical protein
MGGFRPRRGWRGWWISFLRGGHGVVGSILIEGALLMAKGVRSAVFRAVCGFVGNILGWMGASDGRCLGDLVENELTAAGVDWTV